MNVPILSDWTYQCPAYRSLTNRVDTASGAIHELAMKYWWTISDMTTSPTRVTDYFPRKYTQWLHSNSTAQHLTITVFVKHSFLTESACCCWLAAGFCDSGAES
jgi:hypothetical protein